MANREQLAIIRRARAGHAEAQLALGKLYLQGSAGLPQSSSTALYWLERAAQQGCEEAWLCIGSHISYDTAQQSEQRQQLPLWYQRAFEAGIMPAALVFARLVLESEASPALANDARAALLRAAQAGLAEAQWLLAQHSSQPLPMVLAQQAEGQTEDGHWVARAAHGGVAPAQQALAEAAWQAADWRLFLQWGLPLARAIAEQHQAWHAACVELGSAPAAVLQSAQLDLLVRCAQAMQKIVPTPWDEMQLFCELAALHGERQAQLQLGLWFARMDACGARLEQAPGSANFKKAIRWLTQASEQGVAQAWYALSKIFLKPEFSQRNVADAQNYLERAAELGHVQAQAECGAYAWRNRREQSGNDIRALYWLQKAAAQGDVGALSLLDKIAPPPPVQPWALAAQLGLTREMVNSQPFLAARIELAVLFGLSRAEALLLDVKQADQGHCLLVDIRAYYGRSKRHLVLVRDLAQRQALDRMLRLFEDVDCGPHGPEGNYRQRLYRLKTCLPQLSEAD